MIVDTFDGWKVMDGELLRRKRLEYNGDGSPLTQEDLSKLFHKPVHPSTICQWEAGKSQPPLARFKELCLILQVDPREFLGIAYTAQTVVVESNPEGGDKDPAVLFKVVQRGGPE